MSQSERILYHLSQGKPISPITALSEYGCFRLASRINELRRLGYDITTEIKEKYSDNEQGIVRYAEYRLRVADRLGEIVPLNRL